MSLEHPTSDEIDRLRRLVEKESLRESLRRHLDQLDLHEVARRSRPNVRLLPPVSGDPGMSEPKDLADAVRQINQLRERLAEAGKAASASYARINSLAAERDRYRCGYEALREVLGMFSEASPGWHRSALVCDDDFRAWQADAGL